MDNEQVEPLKDWEIQWIRDFMEMHDTYDDRSASFQKEIYAIAKSVSKRLSSN